MTDHEKFKALMDTLGLTYKTLAEALGLQYDSVRNQLAPAKELPKWAKSMLLVAESQKPKSEETANFLDMVALQIAAAERKGKNVVLEENNYWDQGDRFGSYVGEKPFGVVFSVKIS